MAMNGKLILFLLKTFGDKEQLSGIIFDSSLVLYLLNIH